MNSHAKLLAQHVAPDRPAISRLRSLLVLYTSDTLGDDALKGAVCDAVSELRDGGAPPETVVVVLKALLEQAHIHQAVINRRPALYEAVIAWGIEEYFIDA
jgi:hypothetical protein